jgi:GNAT superfamily N-acetyltransferase
MLLSGRGEVFGISAEQAEPSFVIGNREREVAAVIRRAEHETIREAISTLRTIRVVVCPLEDREHVASALAEWRASSATLHLLDSEEPASRLAGMNSRILSAAQVEKLDHLPPELNRELSIVAPHCLIGASYDGPIPVSFCYVAWETESLWDVSIETLAEYRGRGHAAEVVSYLIKYMRERGKEPVWGAEDSNTASMKLAQRLGFSPVDRLAIFHAP